MVVRDLLSLLIHGCMEHTSLCLMMTRWTGYLKEYPASSSVAKATLGTVIVIGLV
jgi:hypothetical protein